MSDYVTWDTAQAMIAQAVAAAQRTDPGPRRVPGMVVSIDGPDCVVEPDDAPGTVVGATRMHPDIVEGSRVKLIYWSLGAADAIGPIPS